MLRLTPPDRVGEFYGLYGMVGRFSAITGPMLWSVATYFAVERGGLPPLTGQALAIVSLLVMVVISYVILRPVTDEPRDWYTLEQVGRQAGLQSVVQVVHPIVTTGRVRGARERASHIPDSLAVPS